MIFVLCPTLLHTFVMNQNSHFLILTAHCAPLMTHSQNASSKQTKPKANMQYMNLVRLQQTARSQHGVGAESHWLKTQVAASLSARWWKFQRITRERLDSLTVRFEGSDSSGLTPSEVLQMSEPSSRHWCDQDVNEQVGDYNAILTWPDEDSAEEPSARPLMSDNQCGNDKKNGFQEATVYCIICLANNQIAVNA